MPANQSGVYAPQAPVVLRGVVIASPGGLSGGGGMGSVTRAMKHWVDQNNPEVKVSVIDPRGGGAALWSLVFLPRAIVKLVWLRLFCGYDLLHLQVSERLSFLRKSLLLLVGRALGMSIVLHHHGAELIPSYRSGSSKSQWLIQWATRGADVNVVLGEVWRRFLITEVAVSEQHIRVLTNATADLKVSHPIPADPWHFILVANLSERKGVGELLIAVAQLFRSGAAVRITLAGGGEIERYRTQARTLGIAERCTFMGWVDVQQIKGLLHSGATLVLPSHHEGLPMTLLEALSANVPIVTTPVGSIPEHLQDGVHCLFVPPGDPGAIANALRRMAGDPALRDRLTRNGRQLYEERFAIDSYMDQLLALYSVLQQGALISRDTSKRDS